MGRFCCLWGLHTIDRRTYSMAFFGSFDCLSLCQWELVIIVAAFVFFKEFIHVVNSELLALTDYGIVDNLCKCI